MICVLTSAGTVTSPGQCRYFGPTQFMLLYHLSRSIYWEWFFAWIQNSMAASSAWCLIMRYTSVWMSSIILICISAYAPAYIASLWGLRASCTCFLLHAKVVSTENMAGKLILYLKHLHCICHVLCSFNHWLDFKAIGAIHDHSINRLTWHANLSMALDCSQLTL